MEPPPEWAPLSLSGFHSCVLLPSTSQIWTPVGDEQAVSPEAGRGGMLAP